MPTSPPDDPKSEALSRSGTLHPHPEKVTDELFRDNPFFDPRDGLQVKYEMLRRVRVDGETVRHAASICGLSRPTYYQALKAFERDGLAGLLPAAKGPRRAHKLTPGILDFIDALLENDPRLRAAEIVERIRDEHQVEVHPKSIERARRARSKKKPRGRA